MLAMALSLLAAPTVYLIAKIASSGRGGSLITQTAAQPMPVAPSTSPIAPPPHPPKLVTKEPPPAVVEVKQPPPPPPPPKDVSTALPTPPVPAPVALPPPVVVAAPKPAPVAVQEPPPVRVEVAPPPAAPAPPVDASPTLPTPRNWGPTIDVPVGDKYAEAAQQGLTVASAPNAAPALAHPPGGFDASLASILAPALARELASKKYDYDHGALRAFQSVAGLAADGVYGDDSWGALLYFTSDAPKALFKPGTPTPYPWAAFVSAAPVKAPVESSAPPMALSPPPDVAIGPVPPAGFNPPQARSLAKPLAAHIDAKKSNYDRARLKAFQLAAGLTEDGIYGGASRRALIFYGVPRPPSALFKPTATPAAYLWQDQANAWSGA